MWRSSWWGVGLYVYLSAPKGSLIWLMAAIAVALVGQAIAGKFVAAAYSGFIGAFLTVPFAMLASRIKTSPPPAIVMMLAAFWALVPGALSFESVSQAATGGNIGVASLGVTGAAILSIALGTVIGWSVFRTIDSRLLGRRDWLNQPYGRFTWVDELSAVSAWMSEQGLGDGPLEKRLRNHRRHPERHAPFHPLGS